MVAKFDMAKAGKEPDAIAAALEGLKAQIEPMFVVMTKGSIPNIADMLVEGADDISISLCTKDCGAAGGKKGKKGGKGKKAGKKGGKKGKPLMKPLGLKPLGKGKKAGKKAGKKGGKKGKPLMKPLGLKPLVKPLPLPPMKPIVPPLRSLPVAPPPTTTPAPTLPPTAAPTEPPTLAPTAAPFAPTPAPTAKPTPVPVPTDPPPPAANAAPGSYPVYPLNCSKRTKPIQLMKYDGGFSAKELDIETGTYSVLFDIPWTDVKGMYSDMGACGVNPYDDILYCVMNSAVTSYIVRLSPGRVSFVAKLRYEIYNTGVFGPNGAFFVATNLGKFTVINDVHSMIGYETQYDAAVPKLDKLPIQKPAAFFSTADVVVITADFDGAGAASYALSLAGPRLQIAKWDGTQFSNSWAIPAGPAGWGDIYGAAWEFGGKVFFAKNNGKGVFEVPLDAIDINTKAPITLEYMGPSEKSASNDGFNCMNVPSPWNTAVKAFDCDSNPAPIQIVQGPFGYSVKKLDLSSGYLLPVYDVPYTYTNPPYRFLNAVGINPKDTIAYGALMIEELPGGKFPGPMYIVRFDDARVEFVGKLNGAFNPIAGTFDAEGNYYFASYPDNFNGHLMMIPSLDKMKGYSSPNATGLADFSGYLQVRLGDVMQIADIVPISYPDDEGKTVNHIVGINRDMEMVIIKWDDANTKVHELRTNDILSKHGAEHASRLNMGAAWNFGGRVMFASNDGVGVFEAKEFNDRSGTLILEKIGMSSSVYNTDGMNCPSGDPFAGNATNILVQKVQQWKW